MGKYNMGYMEASEFLRPRISANNRFLLALLSSSTACRTIIWRYSQKRSTPRICGKNLQRRQGFKSQQQVQRQFLNQSNIFSLFNQFVKFYNNQNSQEKLFDINSQQKQQKSHTNQWKDNKRKKYNSQQRDTVDYNQYETLWAHDSMDFEDD